MHPHHQNRRLKNVEFINFQFRAFQSRVQSCGLGFQLLPQGDSRVLKLFSKIKIYLRQHSFKISTRLVFNVCSIDFSRQEENLVEPVCEVEQKKPEVDIYERSYLFCKIFLVHRILNIFWRHCSSYTRFLGDSLVQ